MVRGVTVRAYCQKDHDQDSLGQQDHDQDSHVKVNQYCQDRHGQLGYDQDDQVSHGENPIDPR